MTDKTPKVFISYAHRDGLEFTRRLAFALEFHMNVFWDRQLKAGDYPKYLNEEIEKCDFLIFVMTPHAIGSEWCKYEVNYALELGKKLVPVRIYNGDGTVNKDIADKYTYSDFSENFEVGFRRITQLILSYPQSSWEVFSQLNDIHLMKALAIGLIPGLIAKEISEWVIAEYIWEVVRSRAGRAKVAIITKPRTPIGILSQSKYILKQLTESPIHSRDFASRSIIRRVIETLEPNVVALIETNESDHKKLGTIAIKIIKNAQKLYLGNELSHRNFLGYAYFNKGYFQFDVAEHLREYVTLHARRSRYLY